MYKSLHRWILLHSKTFFNLSSSQSIRSTYSPYIFVFFCFSKRVNDFLPLTYNTPLTLRAPKFSPPFPFLSSRFALNMKPFVTFQSFADFTLHTCCSLKESIVKAVHSLNHRTAQQLLSLRNDVLEHLTPNCFNKCRLNMSHLGSSFSKK